MLQSIIRNSDWIKQRNMLQMFLKLVWNILGVDNSDKSDNGVSQLTKYAHTEPTFDLEWFLYESLQIWNTFDCGA